MNTLAGRLVTERTAWERWPPFWSGMAWFRLALRPLMAACAWWSSRRRGNDAFAKPSRFGCKRNAGWKH